MPVREYGIGKHDWKENNLVITLCGHRVPPYYYYWFVEVVAAAQEEAGSILVGENTPDSNPASPLVLED